MQLSRESPKNSIKTHVNAKLRKGPRKPKKSKWTKDAQEKTNGTQEPASNVIKEPSKIEANNFAARMMEWHGKRW